MADPRARFAKIRDGLTPREWARAGAMTAIVIGLNVLGWAMLAAAVGGHYHLSGSKLFGFGTGVLAYTLGMRHAFDADHIAAIDNTTRKLVSDGKRPLSVGFFFSLGHSSIVFVLALLLNFGIRSLDHQVGSSSSGLHTVTGIVGTTISGTFLYLIAALNAVILVGIMKILREMRRGRYSDEELERQLDNRGLMNRIFGGYARRIDAPWKMYPVGALFGLGFDTATEVGLLVMAGTAVVSGLPFYAILSLPILFAAGMCLFDTIDGCFMNFAYDWAFARPVRKVFYNLTITGLSVFVAFFIGTIEILGLIGQEYRLSGGFWSFMGNFNINKAGFVIVGMFVVTWAVALSVWHFGRIEQKWDLAATEAAAGDLVPRSAWPDRLVVRWHVQADERQIVGDGRHSRPPAASKSAASITRTSRTSPVATRDVTNKHGRSADETASAGPGRRPGGIRPARSVVQRRPLPGSGKRPAA